MHRKAGNLIETQILRKPIGRFKFVVHVYSNWWILNWWFLGGSVPLFNMSGYIHVLTCMHMLYVQ
jgi:hypothetical protein